MATTKTRNQGKTAFIKEVLFDNPLANAKAVNVAWQAAGMEGTVSETLVNKMRSELGLTGNLRKRSKPAAGEATTKSTKGKKATTAKTNSKAPAVAKAAATATEKKAQTGELGRLLAEVEGDLDRLIFKLMVVGGLERIEDELRRVRRQVVRSHKA